MLKDEYDKITREIIGCALKIHNILGNEFQEVVYAVGIVRRDELTSD
jgi:hypothetical protein